MNRQVDRQDAPRWLDADELASFRAFMNVVRRLPAELDCALQRNSNLSFMEYYVLALLADQPDSRMRMSRLAVKVNAELSRLSHMIKRLENRDLVRREIDPGDGRFTNAVLTDEGRALQAEAAPAHVALVRELLIDVLEPEELRTLHRYSDKVMARIDER